MNVYAIAGMIVGALVLVAFGVNYMFFRTGISEGKSAAKLDATQDDIVKQREADSTVMTEVSKDDVQKSLRDGTF